jgi:antirestriction protein ArdC
MMPQNATTGARYRGINVLTLAMSPLAFVTSDPRWTTYKQASERSWQARKGSRGTTAFFYKRLEIQDRDGGNDDGSEIAKWIPLLRAFTLFHASQIDGIPSYLQPGVEDAPWRAPDAAETVSKNSRAAIRIGGERAFYSPGTDHVQMPPQVAFRSPAAWASVQLHELSHWTGSSARLNRDLTGSFGSESYSREELRAEIAQVMLCFELGIADCEFTNGAAYIASWLRKLRNDKKEVFRAASDAQRIADYLLTYHPDWVDHNGRNAVPQQDEAGPTTSEDDLAEAARWQRTVYQSSERQARRTTKPSIVLTWPAHCARCSIGLK